MGIPVDFRLKLCLEAFGVPAQACVTLLTLGALAFMNDR